MRHTIPSIALLLLLTGCGAPAGTLLSNGTDADSVSLASLGGRAYAKFRVDADLPRDGAPKNAVKLSYMIADDRVFGYLKRGASMPGEPPMPVVPGLDQTMEGLGTVAQGKAHSLIFFDGIKADDTRLRYAQGPRPASQWPSSSLLPGVSEVQSNNPKVLSETLRWTLDNYDQPRRYLHIMTHGLGAFGFGADEIQTAPDGTPLPKSRQLRLMPVADFGAALRSGLGGRQLDLTWFTSCYMSNLEALGELRGLTRYALASEAEFILKSGAMVDMPRRFEALLARGDDPLSIARDLATMANADYPRNGQHMLLNPAFTGFNTIAVVDVDRLGPLTQAVDELGRALMGANAANRSAILAAYDETVAFDGQSTGMRDLLAFTHQLERRVTDRAVMGAIAKVKAAQASALLFEQDSFGDEAHGLSILMPVREDLKKHLPFVRGDYRRTRFAKETSWDEFLLSLPATN